MSTFCPFTSDTDIHYSSSQTLWSYNVQTCPLTISSCATMLCSQQRKFLCLEPSLPRIGTGLLIKVCVPINKRILLGSDCIDYHHQKKKKKRLAPGPAHNLVPIFSLSSQIGVMASANSRQYMTSVHLTGKVLNTIYSGGLYTYKKERTTRIWEEG